MGARVNKEKPKNVKTTLKRLIKYIGKSKLLILLLVLIMVAVTVCDLAGPALQGAAIDTVKISELGEITVELEDMLGYLSVMLVIFIFSGVLTVLFNRIEKKLDYFRG